MFSFSKRLILSSLLLVSTLCVNAQAKTQTFSTKPQEFLQEIYDLFVEADPEMAEGFYAEFKAVFPMEGIELKKRLKLYKTANKSLKLRYKKLKVKAEYLYTDNTPKFNNYQIQAIVLTCNQMMANRLKAIPHFSSYFNSLLSFINTNQSEDSFDAWNIALNKLLSENKRYFNTFIDNCNSIFLYRSVYVSRNVRWIRTSDQFTFDYDSLPKVVFPPMDLYCLAKGDTAYIYNTEGSYYLTKGLWVGKGGRVLWKRAGISESQSYADLNKYKIEMKSSFYTADSVSYANAKYFEGEVKGRLEEKLLANTTVKNAVFPQFYSYSGKVKISELEPGIDYEGGFLIKGSKFIGKGVADERAKVIFKRKNKPFLIADANSFTMNEERIGTKAAKIVILMDGDSIFHPSLKLKFLIEKRELTLFREEQGLSAAPYSNTYHNMDMYLEWLKWNIDESAMEFTTLVGSSNDELRLESANYYSPSRFNKLQGLQEVHPLYVVRDFIEKKNDGDRVFKDSDLAAHFKLDENSIQRLLIKFANLGFVMYDIQASTVTAQQRLFDYLDAKSKKKDYDNITIVSKMKGKPNAIFNLENFDIELAGVRGVVLSEIRQTGYLPAKREMLLHRNRDMTFDGILRSGNYEFHGKEFMFSYDDFRIGMPVVDSLRLKAKDIRIDKEKGKAPYTMVNSVIEGLAGSLQIDPPHNKSGILIDSFPEYPGFKSEKESYVYYNKRNARGDAYHPNKVYYKLDPFEVDSIGTYSNEGIRFAGSFTSGGIFAEMRQDLVLMPDHSLGFTRETALEGEAVYGGKATFKNQIKLSNQGIMGDGDFEYITSVTQSNAMVFYLDSMNAMAQNYSIQEVISDVEYPDVEARNVNVHYEPGPDFMSIKNTTFPMTMYNFEARMDGELIYNREKMVGSGVIDFDNAELKADLFDFKHTKFMSDTADFKLKAEDPTEGEIAFATNNVKATIDLEKREGEFLANDGASYVDFPVNKYICFMDQFKWFMDNYELELSSNKGSAKSANTGAGGSDLDLAGAEFISTHEKQDSLVFISPRAKYDLKNYIITAHEVKYINVADARIYTGDGEVVVKKNADMQTLESAEIVANVTTKYHTISNATVDIEARRDYKAEGDYQYIDAEGNGQNVHFNNIRVDAEFQTVASGPIGESQNFMLNPYFEFKGETSIVANKLGMFFNGGARLVHECDMSKPWLAFKADIDPADVLIPVDENIKGYDEKAKVFTGVTFNRDTAKMYNLFLGTKRFHADEQIVTATGFLKYNDDEQEYQISSKEKLNEFSFAGNFVGLNTETCDLKGEGKLSLAADLGQVKMLTAGAITSTIADNEQSMSSIVAFDFLLDGGMWKVIEDAAEAAKLDKVFYSETFFEKGISELAGKEVGDKLVSELNLFGKFKKVPDEFKHDLLFSDVKFQWEKGTRSFISVGQLGLGLIGKTQVHKYVDGYIQVIRKKNKEAIHIYFEVDPGTWFYFSYSKGIMKVLSSESSFNATISSLKEDKRSNKGSKKTGPYVYILGSELQKSKFVSMMEAKADELQSEVTE